VGSFEAIGKELRLQNAYNVKSDYFAARITVTINEITEHAGAVLQPDANIGKGTAIYLRIL